MVSTIRVSTAPSAVVDGFVDPHLDLGIAVRLRRHGTRSTSCRSANTRPSPLALISFTGHVSTDPIQRPPTERWLTVGWRRDVVGRHHPTHALPTGLPVSVRCTAIWSPSKSALLHSTETRGVQLDGLTFGQYRFKPGAQTVVKGRCTVEENGCSRITSTRTSQTSDSRSTIFLAALMVVWTAHFQHRMNGRRLGAIFLGEPHWCRRRVGPTVIAGDGVVNSLPSRVLTETTQHP